MKLLVKATNKPAANLAYCSGADFLKSTSSKTDLSSDLSVTSDNFSVVESNFPSLE